VFRRPTIEQLSGFIQPTWQALVDGARFVNPRLEEIIAELEPDVICEDNVPSFPALPACGRPWVRIVSCNPLEVKDPAIAPVFSGYPADDRSSWEEFRAEYLRATRDLHGEFSAFCTERGAPPLPEGDFMQESAWLNLYVLPAEIDYARSRPLAPTWHRLETCVRRMDETFDLPEPLGARDGRLVYVSLGSLGSADTELMERLVDVLSRSRHRFVVSKGPQHDEYELAENMRGAEFLPQPAILPHVDAVVTHAGNNTTTECFHFGKPMVALPLFWDQYDNAQRVDETGFGVRLPTYEVGDELLAALDRVLDDDAACGRLAAISARVQATPGTVKAADLIERLAI
jgi:MGT family glycosyltransferase